MNLCIDASVFVAAIRVGDGYHYQSIGFFNALGVGDHDFYCPTLVLAETVAAVARTMRNPALNQEARRIIEELPGINLIDLTAERARRSADVAAAHFVRGADSVYIAIAEEFGCTLITWDGEMIDRGRAVVQTMTPTAWISANQA